MAAADAAEEAAQAEAAEKQTGEGEIVVFTMEGIGRGGEKLRVKRKGGRLSATTKHGCAAGRLELS